jgi:hypothetical protein
MAKKQTKVVVEEQAVAGQMEAEAAASAPSVADAVEEQAVAGQMEAEAAASAPSVADAPEAPEAEPEAGGATEAEIAYARRILAGEKKLEAVYIIGGLYFSSKQRAEGRSAVTGERITTVSR